MDNIEFVHQRYLELRDAIVSWLGKHLQGPAWYYRPTPLSNGAAWIVPHLVAFEQQRVFDRIAGHDLARVVPVEVVERYKPGASGWSMPDADLMSAEEALAALARGRAATDAFLSRLRAGDPALAGVDRAQVFERYLLNFTHDTEHYGQLKYLTGTWERLAGAGGLRRG